MLLQILLEKNFIRDKKQHNLKILNVNANYKVKSFEKF